MESFPYFKILKAELNPIKNQNGLKSLIDTFSNA